MMKAIILLNVLHILYLNEAFNFSCPSQSHWQLRAKSKCKQQKNYTCLYDVNLQVNVYRDKCNRPNIVGPGYKYVFEPNLNRAECRKTRYQPFIFETVGYSDCTFLKSLCNSEGQATYENGTTTSDRTCMCNYDKGYIFVRNKTNQCYCNPSNEDCSCYIPLQPINKMDSSKDLKCYAEIKLSPTPLGEDTFNKSEALKIHDFDNYTYNIGSATNEYRRKAAISVLISVSSFLSVAVGVYILQRLIRHRIQIHTTVPKNFAIVECTYHSITVEWYVDDSDDRMQYELMNKLRGSDDWKIYSLSNGDFLAEETGRHVYKLCNLLPETYYELKLCSVYNHSKSTYTKSETQQTKTIVLPKAIHRLQDEDRNRYVKLMQSSKTEKRYFVKIMIVGKESVGKTCLLRRLLKESIADVSSTDGVDIVTRRCKINIETGDWTIGNDIYDDKIGRIQNAIIQNERIKNKAARTEVSNNFYQSSFTIASDYETTHMEGQAENHKSISENTATNLSKLEPTTQIGDKDDFTPLENDIQDNIKDNKDVTFTSTKSTLKENEDQNRSLSLLMPQDLLSCVFSTTSTSNIPSNLYALCGLWDFAGQKEFYATHQAFLTSSAIYLVVADIRDDIFQEDTKRCFAEFRHVGEYVDFWFDTIHCHRTVHSQVNEPYNHYIDPPIIVVFTGKDKYEEKNKGKQNIEKRLKELQLQLDMLFGDHSKYHHLRKIFCLSNSNDPDEEFKKLRLEISTTAKKMDNWGECMPLKWILLEHLIEIIKQDGKNFINLSDMVHMAKHRDINILDIKDVLIFLRFQHETGNIIFFEDIQDFIILNPNWLVDAFRCLVSDKVDDKLQHRGDWTEFARKGHISDSLITELFKSKCGSQFLEERKNLVKVMEKFDILVTLDEAGKYVMPSMMPNEKFEKVCKQIGVENPNCKRSSWLCLKFAFLPPAFFNHFTVWFMKIYKPSKIDNKQHRLALFRGICVFDIGEFGCEKLLVSMSSNTIALQHLSFSTNDFGSGCSNIHKELIRKIEDIKKRYKLEISHELHFKCSTGLYYEDTISYQTLKKSKEYYCEEHKRVHQSEKIYLPWMKDADEDENSKTDHIGKVKSNEKQKDKTDTYGNDKVYFGGKEEKKKDKVETIESTSTMSALEMEILLTVSKSVGIFHGPKANGTCWRVGEDKIMTAAHVVRDNIWNGIINTEIESELERCYVDFDYTEKTKRTSNAESDFVFKIEPQVMYRNEVLDVAVLKLKREKHKQFPPPLESFDSLDPDKDDDKAIYLIDHDKSDEKKFNFGIGLWNPTDERMKGIEKFCKEYGKGNGYIGLDRKDRLVIQCKFVSGASGCPGVIIYKRKAFVVLVYVRGYPDFYYSKQLPDREREKFPKERLLQQGVNIGYVFKTMTTSKMHLGLRNEIFPHEAYLEQQSSGQHQYTIGGAKTSTDTYKSDSLFGNINHLKDISETQNNMEKGTTCTEEYSETAIPEAAKYNRQESYALATGKRGDIVYPQMQPPADDTDKTLQHGTGQNFAFYRNEQDSKQGLIQFNNTNPAVPQHVFRRQLGMDPGKEKIYCMMCKTKTNNLQMVLFKDPASGIRRAKALCVNCKREKSMFLN